MASRTAILCTFLILIATIRTACLVLTTPSRIPEEWLRPRIEADAETLLAFGAQIPLACADISDLELIPGVSDNLAKELLDMRTRIIAHARNHSPYEALQLARGVGAHKAELLSSRLSLEDACYQGESYIPFEIPHSKPTPYSALRLSSSRH
jgi:hypothetical protein